MGMATEQDLPLRKTEKSEWSMRNLFPIKAMTGVFAKTFINVFDVLLGFAVVTIALGELLGRNVSWLFYGLTLALIVAAYNERHFNDTKNESV